MGSGARQLNPLLALTLLVLSACGSDEPDWRALEPLAFGDDTLSFEWAPSPLAFGPASLRVRLRTRGSESIIYEGRIANDGVDIGYENLLPVVDRPPELFLCLNGAEQDDLYVRIHVKTATVVEAARECRR
jgi:hypothetical protein